MAQEGPRDEQLDFSAPMRIPIIHPDGRDTHLFAPSVTNVTQMPPPYYTGGARQIHALVTD
ncbi:Hypothetical predicted protein [Pelobates cultripes]|uniref:Uncharacterized protein n=1 Tax=Pelobates cultripes TaxID=61616 RepID=A0AAD1S8B8_PELCU|nr:Hypothetical predicted protein [Pelobates cultripes]